MLAMKKIFFMILALLTGTVLITVPGCKKTALRETTTDDVNILAFLQKDSTGRFSLLVEAVEKAEYQPFLNAYGTYTLFAPTNEAMDAYLKQQGKNSLAQLDQQQVRDMLRFHLLEEQVLTSEFNDGKLSAMTMFGQYLVTGVENTDGISSYRVNRQANVVDANLKTGNGIIQVIDHVLTPAVKSVAQLVEEDTDYSIFTQALKETGWYDVLNQATSGTGKKWYTLIGETNQALLDTGIVNYADLKARYNNTGDPKNPADSLYLYVAYHILPEVKYLADIVLSSAHETMVPLEVITNKFINKQVLLNEDQYSTIDGVVTEPGILLDQTGSDRSATNGVVHKALAHLSIKIRNPFPVYWDLCAAVPELTRLSNVYRKQTYLFDYADGNAFKDVKWERSCLKYRNGVQGYLGDYWQVGMGRSSSNTNSLGTCQSNSWIEFTTPLLVKGRYKVWFGYYTQNSTATAVQASFDSVPLTNALINFAQKIAKINPPAEAEAEMEALGWKWWAGAARKSGSTVSRLVGIVDVRQTGRHKLRFDLVSGSNADCNFDMVHFIPVGMNQTRPRFNPDGTIEYGL